MSDRFGVGWTDPRGIFGTTELEKLVEDIEKLRSLQYPITDHPPEVKTEISWEEVDNIVTKLGEK